MVTLIALQELAHVPRPVRPPSSSAKRHASPPADADADASSSGPAEAPSGMKKKGITTLTAEEKFLARLPPELFSRKVSHSEN